MAEPKLIGKVIHYYSGIGVAAIDLTGKLKTGDTVRIKGSTTDFTQKIESMQIEHADIEIAKAGDEFGIKVEKPVKKNSDIVKV